MNDFLFTVEMLIDYFQNSKEQFAVEVRNHFTAIEKPIAYIEFEPLLENWIDNQDVMNALHISSRTLQTLRSNGTLPYSRIGKKIYYQKKDIVKMLAANYDKYKSNFE